MPKAPLYISAILMLSLLFGTKASKGQIFFVESSRTKGEISVEVVTDKFKADLWVFMVENRAKANRDGLWYFAKTRSVATKRLYFLKKNGIADLKIYFVKRASQAGWIRNKTKSQLFR